MKVKFRNREISWLSFNARVLQEATDPTVPLLERLRFLGIFSANLDEFFRVRVAVLKRLAQVGKPARKMIGDDPNKILSKLQRIVLKQQADFEAIYQGILQELAQEQIYIIDANHLSQEQESFVQQYIRYKLRPILAPLMINQLAKPPELRDHSVYLAVYLATNHSKQWEYALIELPTHAVSRFLLLPPVNNQQTIILLDDIIRYCLPDLFSNFKFDHLEAFTIKVTRDAELNLDTDFSESYIRKISKSLKQRKLGAPVRFVYDSQMPDRLLRHLTKKMRMRKSDSTFIAGGRYHNFKDFTQFPRLGPQHLHYEPWPPLPHRDLQQHHSIFEVLDQQDILLHHPYQSFDYLTDLLQEAAIDPHVTAVQMTLYRVAEPSHVVNVLMNAAQNGKAVTVVMELQARFDEARNVRLAQLLQDEGVRVIDGVPGLKVHAKLLLISRQKRKSPKLYAALGTGNFNETTAGLYSDHCLFTTDVRITAEVKKVFDFLDENFKIGQFRHLLVSPFNMRRQLMRCIDREINNARRGKEAFVFLKVNNLEDRQLINKLYQASQAGVEIRLLVRSVFSLIPGVKGMSERIRAASIVDRFLEHSRLFVFCAAGEGAYYLSSADLMSRNMDNRVEVACPVYDKNIQQELNDYLDIQWQDTVKARVLNKKFDNKYRKNKAKKSIRSQEKLYEYFKVRSG
ncbi:Polyphosphate kinase [Candidatus Entotheonellaceae bacterium PAL068K]